MRETKIFLNLDWVQNKIVSQYNRQVGLITRALKLTGVGDKISGQGSEVFVERVRGEARNFGVPNLREMGGKRSGKRVTELVGIARVK